MAFKDRRRFDARELIQGIPVWITTDEIDVAEVGGAGVVVLHDFSRDNGKYIITACVLEVIENFNAGTVNVGHGTMPDKYTPETGTITTTDADSLWPTATGNETTGTIESWFDMSGAPVILNGNASPVPVIIATIATAVSGKFRVHFLVSEIPQY